MAKEMKHPEPLVVAGEPGAALETLELTESDKCEIIETAIDELDLLTRAFAVIRDACAEMQAPLVELPEIPEDAVIH